MGEGGGGVDPLGQEEGLFLACPGPLPSPTTTSICDTLSFLFCCNCSLQRACRCCDAVPVENQVDMVGMSGALLGRLADEAADVQVVQLTERPARAALGGHVELVRGRSFEPRRYVLGVWGGLIWRLSRLGG